MQVKFLSCIFSGILRINLMLLTFVASSVSVASAQEISPQTHGWYEVPNTTLSPYCPENNFNDYGYEFANYCQNVTRAWNSAAHDTSRNRIYFFGGGHHDYYGNELYAFDIEKGSFSRITDPGQPADPDADPKQSELAPFDGTQPNSRHTYDGFAYLQKDDLLWVFSGSLAGKAGGVDNLTWVFDIENGQWKKLSPRGDIPAGITGVVSAYDPVTEVLYLHNRNGFYSYTYDAEGGEYKLLNSEGSLGLGVTAEIDPVNRKFVIVGNGSLITYDLSESSNYAYTQHELLGDTEFIEDYFSPGLIFNNEDAMLYAWAEGSNVYRASLTDLTWERFTFNSGPDSYFSQGTFDRLVYLPNKKAMFVYSDINKNAFTFKFPNAEDSEPPTAPQNVNASSPYERSIALTWQESTDDFGVAGYKVFFNGTEVVETENTSYKMFLEETAQSVDIQVQAYDSQGNTSEKSSLINYQVPELEKVRNLGDCASETKIDARDDIVFCESWDSDSWWQDHGYLDIAAVEEPREVQASSVENVEIVSEGCLQGKCLQVNMNKGDLRALSVAWPLKEANVAPDNVFLRYHIKLSDNWDGNMCDSDGEIVGAGGKFPGIADIRTYRDSVGQCGNGGYSGDGLNCFSQRAIFGGCSNDDGSPCSLESDVATRFGSYIYHNQQNGSTGDAGYWHGASFGQSGASFGTCDSSSSNMNCGKGDGGLFQRGIWYQVEMQITMNDVGQNNGIIRGWVDGQLSFEKLNVEFRESNHDLLHNRLIWLDIYKGGVYGNCSDSKVYLDQMVVALDKPVGGLASDTLPAPDITMTVSSNDISKSEQIQVDWQAENSQTCQASGLWEGEKSTLGSETISPEVSGYVKLHCQGTGGTSLREFEVIVDGKPIVDQEPPVDDGGGDITGPINTIEVSRLLVTEQGEHSVLVSWDLPSESQSVVTYNVYLNESLVASTEQASVSVANLPSGALATFSVRTVNEDEIESSGNLKETIKIDAESLNTILLSQADTFLATSTFQNLGAEPYIETSKTRNLLIKFSDEQLGSLEELGQALLELNTYQEFGDIELEIYAVEKPWEELLATRDYAISSSVAWDNLNGDWLDKQLDPQGDIPFASIKLDDDDLPNKVQIDISELVRQWHSDLLQNNGLLIKVRGLSTFKFYSRENSDFLLWPKLVINNENFNTVDVNVSEDVTLNKSTFRNLGRDDSLGISPNQNTLLRFGLPEAIDSDSVISATLTLNNFSVTGQSSRFKVMLPNKRWMELQATREFFIRFPNGVWENFLGDWNDASGDENGSEAFFESDLFNLGNHGQIQLDVTDAVRQWLQTDLTPTVEFMLIAPDMGVMTFDSKEAETGISPILTIDYGRIK